MSARVAGRIALVACLAHGPCALAAQAQTPELAADAAAVIDALRRQGVSDLQSLLEALGSAWAAERSEEYARLRSLGITPTDAELDVAWQNQAGRAAQFSPYDLEEWATDVLRSWARTHPRDAFTWLFAVRSAWGFALPRRDCFERVVTEWVRTSPTGAGEARVEALAIDDEALREEAVIGVIRGDILRGDPRDVPELLRHVASETRRREIEALYARYIR